MSWNIKDLILAGDVFDLSALSIFLAKDGDKIEEELTEDEEYFGQLIDGFERVTYLMGNHEDRVRRRMNKWISSQRIAKFLGISRDVRISDYFWCLVGNDWLIEHPKNTSEIPARADTWLAEKYRRNVAGFHNHVTGSAQTRDGGLIAIDVGMCADEQRLEYVSIRHNKRPRMSNGALILRWDAEEMRYYSHHLTQHTDFKLLERLHESL